MGKLEPDQPTPISKLSWIAQANVYLNHRDREQAYTGYWLDQKVQDRGLAVVSPTRVHPRKTR
jgi:hypothetical protein